MGGTIDLDGLLGREDQSVEWKTGGYAEQVVRTLCAFANAYAGRSTGGWVLAGIEEVADKHGFPQPSKKGLSAAEIRKLQRAVIEQCLNRVSPPLSPTLYELAVEGDDSRRILAFYQPASPHAHKYRFQSQEPKYWIRMDDQTVQAREVHLDLLLQHKRVMPQILERPCFEAGLEDLNLLAAEQFMRDARLPRPLSEYLKPGVSIGHGAGRLVERVEVSPETFREVPTYLALLLFGHKPTQFLPGAYVVVSIYSGTSRDESHHERIEASAPLPKLILDLLEKLALYAGTDVDKSVASRERPQNRPRYSDKALQEAVVNAFAHRDYGSHQPTRVTIFSDRMEIQNPGGVPPGIDSESLVQGRGGAVWRNDGLTRFLLKMSLAQSQGEGIPTIIRETEGVSGRKAQIIPGEADFKVVLPAYQRPSLPVRSGSGEAEGDGLLMVSIGAESVLRVVEQSLEDLGLVGSPILVDIVSPNYLNPDDPVRWQAEARRIRNEIRAWVENPKFTRFHLFYRGPVVIAPLLGALIAPAKPLVVYHYENGRYTPAYILERSFLIAKD